jgi:hypothetical protein
MQQHTKKLPFRAIVFEEFFKIAFWHHCEGVFLKWSRTRFLYQMFILCVKEQIGSHSGQIPKEGGEGGFFEIGDEIDLFHAH